MSFRMMNTSPEKQHPQTTVHSSPNFSQYGHSPSIAPPAYTTDDLLAAKYNKVSKWTTIIRVAIAFTSLCISVAVLGCAADSLQEYSYSNTEQPWLLPLWPTSVDLRPTHTILACGIVITVFSLAYLVLAFIPMVSHPSHGAAHCNPRIKHANNQWQRNQLHKLNLASTILAFLTIFVTLFTTIYASTIISNFSSAANAGSLISWTCQWQGFEDRAPPNFTKICNEGSAGLDMVIALAVLSVLSTAASAAGWWAEMMLRRGGADGETKSQVELVHHV